MDFLGSSFASELAAGDSDRFAGARDCGSGAATGASGVLNEDILATDFTEGREGSVFGSGESAGDEDDAAADDILEDERICAYTLALLAVLLLILTLLLVLELAGRGAVLLADLGEGTGDCIGDTTGEGC